MNFCSDNVAGASPEILQALSDANRGSAMPYGDDPLTERAIGRLRELFETDAEVLFLATGSSANALALAVMTPPYGSVYCHPESHVNADECGAPEFFSGGAKLVPVLGANGKLTPDALEMAITGAGVVHHTQPAAVSVTQVTEAGTLYTLAELRAIADICKRHGLKLHMDGARFANAVDALGCSPADASHRLGVDALTFGATKNGALCAEAVLFFDRELAREAGYRRKRAGHLSLRCGSSLLSSMLTSKIIYGAATPSMRIPWRSVLQKGSVRLREFFSSIPSRRTSCSRACPCH